MGPCVPMWEFMSDAPPHHSCCDGDILITVVDPKHELGAHSYANLGPSQEVISASSRECATRNGATVMSFAAPHAIYQEGHNLLDEVKEVVLDSGSTSALTSSSQNCENCEPISVKIMLAKKNQTMEAKFKCTKTYYFRNRTGILQKLVTPAYIVPDLQTNLLGCKNLTRDGYSIILDKDPEISEV